MKFKVRITFMQFILWGEVMQAMTDSWEQEIELVSSQLQGKYLGARGQNFMIVTSSIV